MLNWCTFREVARTGSTRGPPTRPIQAPRRGFVEEEAMPSSLRYSVVVVAFAGALVAVPCSVSATPNARATTTAPATGGASLLAVAWSWLRTLLPNAGCGMDPSGAACSTSRPRPGADTGCGLDPSGRLCMPAPQPGIDEGCGLDPSGSKNCASNGHG
jgi:hypothetical protein